LKSWSLLLVIISFFTIGLVEVHAQPKECPELRVLEETSIKDKEELIDALNTLIPETYGTGLDDLPDIYAEWNVVTAKPFPKTVGNVEEEVYFEMAKNFCGKEIAEKSWLVRLNFPKAPGANLAQGQLFLGKSKVEGWFIWFRYH
jgi:hypothetical protein